VVGLIGLGIVGGPRSHGPTFAQGDFSVKVMRHIAKLKLWKSLERRIRVRLYRFLSGGDDECNEDVSPTDAGSYSRSTSLGA